MYMLERFENGARKSEMESTCVVQTSESPLVCVVGLDLQNLKLERGQHFTTKGVFNRGL